MIGFDFALLEKQTKVSPEMSRKYNSGSANVLCSILRLATGQRIFWYTVTRDCQLAVTHSLVRSVSAYCVDAWDQVLFQLP